MKKMWGWVLALVALVLVVAGGLWFYQRHQQKAQAAAEAQTFKRVATRQQAAHARVEKVWVGGEQNFVKAGSGATLDAAAQDAKDFERQVKPYKRSTARYRRFAAAQKTLTTEIDTAKATLAATTAVNKLFAKKVITGDRVDTAQLVREETTEAKLKAVTPTAAAGSAAIQTAVADLTEVGEAQIKERATLAAAAKRVADGAAVRKGAKEADLKAFNKVVAGLRFKGLAAQYAALQKAVNTKLASLHTIKTISLDELRRRILVVALGGDALPTAKGGRLGFLDDSMDGYGFSGNTYKTTMNTLTFGGSFGPMPKQLLDVTVEINGDYRLSSGTSNAISGNLFKDVTSAQVAEIFGDPSKVVGPKDVTPDDLARMYQEAYPDYDAEQTDYDRPLSSEYVGASLMGSGTQYYVRYNKADAYIEVMNLTGMNDEGGWLYDGTLTRALWEK